MATTKLSITVDSEMLERIKHFLPADYNLSALLNEALRERLRRFEALAILDDMDRNNPISEAGEIAGDKLWQTIESSWTPAPSPRLQTKKKQSVSQRGKR